MGLTDIFEKSIILVIAAFSREANNKMDENSSNKDEWTTLAFWHKQKKIILEMVNPNELQNWINQSKVLAILAIVREN